jgi:putative transposase
MSQELTQGLCAQNLSPDRRLAGEVQKYHRFPAEIINHGVWLYHCFCLSYRDVEELLFVRGVLVSYEAIRTWCRKFGQAYANQLCRRRPRPGDKWHLDEVFLTIHGERHYLWRAVDQDGNVLDILVQSRRNKQAAKKFFRKLLKGLTYVPRVIITDKLKSYGAAKREILPGVEHRQHRYLNNRAENSHQPTRQRERRMQGFKVCWACATLPRSIWADCSTLPPSAPSVFRARIPSRNAEKMPGVERDHRHKDGCLRAACVQSWSALVP